MTGILQRHAVGKVMWREMQGVGRCKYEPRKANSPQELEEEGTDSPPEPVREHIPAGTSILDFPPPARK